MYIRTKSFRNSTNSVIKAAWHQEQKKNISAYRMKWKAAAWQVTSLVFSVTKTKESNLPKGDETPQENHIHSY